MHHDYLAGISGSNTNAPYLLFPTNPCRRVRVRQIADLVVRRCGPGLPSLVHNSVLPRGWYYGIVFEEQPMDRDSLEHILNVIRRMAETRDLTSLLNYVMDESIKLVGAERGYVVLVQTDGTLDLRVKRGQGGEELEGTGATGAGREEVPGTWAAGLA